MIVSDLIRASLRKLNALSTGEGVLTIQEIPGEEYVDYLQALQVMLRSWAQQKITVYASKRESFTLVPGQLLYTWGTSGNITTLRPHKIISAFVRDSNGTDSLVEIISQGQYNSIFTKTDSGRPGFLFYHPEYPLGNVYLFPNPQSAETMWIDSLKPFTETDSFENVDQIIAFPPNYEEALIYNLAIRIAPEKGISASAEVVSIAEKSYSAITGLNAANAVEPARLSLPIGWGYGYGGGYDINRGY